jgi:putative acetyltransferase
MLIRNETPRDIPAISRLVTEALLLLPQSTGTEASIVEKLRADGALLLSLVAEDEGEAVGYLAASAARIGTQGGWGLIGPLVVSPSRHRQGIGSALMEEALRRLRATGRGAALVGDPAYYGRFGFRAFPGLGVAGCPPEVVQALPFDGSEPRGELIHPRAFGLDQQE